MPLTGMENTGKRAQWEGIEEDKINFGHTRFENPLRHVSGVSRKPWIYEQKAQG